MPDCLHHICLVSDQNVPELLGALLCAPFDVHIHAITTPKMTSNAANFEKTCRKSGIECSLHALPLPGIAEIGSLLDKVHAERKHEGWAVNITGGTKLMTLGAYAWAAQNDIPAFYIDTANRTYELYTGGRWQSQPLPSILGFEALLNLYGYEVRASARAQTHPGHFAAANMILGLAGQKDGLEAIHVLNERAFAAGPRADWTVPYDLAPGMAKLLAICRTGGQLDYTKSRIAFRGEAGRQWCNGIWLEEFVQAILAGLESENMISSWAANVKIAGDGYSNELDAIFTAHNRLYVIECKTSRLAGRPAAASILYKAEKLSPQIK